MSETTANYQAINTAHDHIKTLGTIFNKITGKPNGVDEAFNKVFANGEYSPEDQAVIEGVQPRISGLLEKPFFYKDVIGQIQANFAKTGISESKLPKLLDTVGIIPDTLNSDIQNLSENISNNPLSQQVMKAISELQKQRETKLRKIYEEDIMSTYKPNESEDFQSYSQRKMDDIAKVYKPINPEKAFSIIANFVCNPDQNPNIGTERGAVWALKACIMNPNTLEDTSFADLELAMGYLGVTFRDFLPGLRPTQDLKELSLPQTKETVNQQEADARQAIYDYYYNCRIKKTVSGTPIDPTHYAYVTREIGPLGDKKISETLGSLHSALQVQEALFYQKYGASPTQYLDGRTDPKAKNVYEIDEAVYALESIKPLVEGGFFNR